MNWPNANFLPDMLAKLYKVTTDFLLCVSFIRAGTYDLNVEFVQGVTIKDVLISLRKMDSHNRAALIQYIHSLNNTSPKGKASKKKASKKSSSE